MTLLGSFGYINEEPNKELTIADSVSEWFGREAALSSTVEGFEVNSRNIETAMEIADDIISLSKFSISTLESSSDYTSFVRFAEHATVSLCGKLGLPPSDLGSTIESVGDYVTYDAAAKSVSTIEGIAGSTMTAVQKGFRIALDFIKKAISSLTSLVFSTEKAMKSIADKSVELKKAGWVKKSDRVDSEMLVKAFSIGGSYEYKNVAEIINGSRNLVSMAKGMHATMEAASSAILRYATGSSSSADDFLNKIDSAADILISSAKNSFSGSGSKEKDGWIVSNYLGLIDGQSLVISSQEENGKSIKIKASVKGGDAKLKDSSMDTLSLDDILKATSQAQSLAVLTRSLGESESKMDKFYSDIESVFDVVAGDDSTEKEKEKAIKARVAASALAQAYGDVNKIAIKIASQTTRSILLLTTKHMSNYKKP